MSSLIANKVNTNMCLVSLYCPHYLMYTTITTCSLYFFTLLFSEALTTVWQNFTTANFKQRLFCLHATSHKVNSILTTLRLLSLALLQSNTNSLSRTFVFSLSQELYCNFIVVCVHTVVCEFTYLFIPFFLMLVVVDLLGACSMYCFMCICAMCQTMLHCF